MHETNIANNIVRIVMDEMKQYPRKKCKKVRVKIGELVAVVPDLLDFAFKTIIKETPYQNASLEMDIVPIKAQCEECSDSFNMKEFNFSCPNCHSIKLKILQGKELYVENLELE